MLAAVLASWVLFTASCFAQDVLQVDEVYDLDEGTCSEEQTEFLNTVLRDLNELVQSCAHNLETLTAYDHIAPKFIVEKTVAGRTQIEPNSEDVYLVQNAARGLGVEDLFMRWGKALVEEGKDSREALNTEPTYTNHWDVIKIGGSMSALRNVHGFLHPHPKARKDYLGCDPGVFKPEEKDVHGNTVYVRRRKGRSSIRIRVHGSPGLCESGARGQLVQSQDERYVLMLCDSFFTQPWPKADHGAGDILANQESPVNWLLLQLLRRLDVAPPCDTALPVEPNVDPVATREALQFDDSPKHISLLSLYSNAFRSLDRDVVTGQQALFDTSRLPAAIRWFCVAAAEDRDWDWETFADGEGDV